MRRFATCFVKGRLARPGCEQPAGGFRATPPSAIVHAVPGFIWGMSDSVLHCSSSVRHFGFANNRELTDCLWAAPGAVRRAPQPDDVMLEAMSGARGGQCGGSGESLPLGTQNSEGKRQAQA